MSVSSEIVIRDARPEEAGALAALARAVFEETFAEGNSDEDMAEFLASTYSESIQSRELSDPSMQTLLAVDGERLAGYAQLATGQPPDWVPERPAIEIKRFYILSHWHGSGVAQALMAECLRRADLYRSAAIWLGVWEHNARAKAFYAKYGFEARGSQPFWLGRDEQTDHILACPLATPPTHT